MHDERSTSRSMAATSASNALTAMTSRRSLSPSGSESKASSASLASDRGTDASEDDDDNAASASASSPEQSPQSRVRALMARLSRSKGDAREDTDTDGDADSDVDGDGNGDGKEVEVAKGTSRNAIAAARPQPGQTDAGSEDGSDGFTAARAPTGAPAPDGAGSTARERLARLRALGTAKKPMVEQAVSEDGPVGRDQVPGQDVESISAAANHRKDDKEEEEEDDEEDAVVANKSARRRVTDQPQDTSPDEHQAPTSTPRRKRGKLGQRRPKHTANSESEEKSDVESARNAGPSTPTLHSRSAASSPGLFVSQGTPPTAAELDSDLDALIDDPATNARVLALATKKRADRKAREAKDKAEREQRRRLDTDMPIVDDNEDHDNIIDDDEGGRRLTQQANPTRKASKKAMEEIARETQRLARTHQQTYRPITKKKFTKESFFGRFKFQQPPSEEEEEDSTAITDAPPLTSSSPVRPVDEDTPATSPIAEPEEPKSVTVLGPSLATILDEQKQIGVELHNGVTTARQEKGKGREIASIRAKPTISLSADSDDDLEIVVNKSSAQLAKLDKFLQQMPAKKAQGSHSLHALRLLAHLTSPEKQGARNRHQKPSMNVAEMQLSLQQRARQQAASERDERIQKLRDSGVVIQSAAERDKALADVEDIMAKARREGAEIAKKEKAAAKEARRANGEVDPLGDSSDDDDDADWVEKGAAQGDGDGPKTDQVDGSDSDSDIDADHSGSSDEDVDDHEDEEDVDSGMAANRMFDEGADESENDGEDQPDTIADEDMLPDAGDESDHEEGTPILRRSRARKSNIIDDDDDEDVAEACSLRTPAIPSMTDSPAQPPSSTPIAPTSVLRSATKTFIPGVTVKGPAGLGLTQMFASTMDDDTPLDQTQDSPCQMAVDNATQQDSMAFLRMQPPPTLPPFIPTMTEDTQEVVQNSQPHFPQPKLAEETAETPIDFSMAYTEAPNPAGYAASPTQSSAFGTPTQDMVFAKMTPILGRFAEEPPSTVDTVLVEHGAGPATPSLRPRRKLRRNARVTEFSDDEQVGDDEAPSDHEEDETVEEDAEDAFAVMREAIARKAAQAEFDRKKSRAKDMVHDQAEESDDEYAGLGGASDDESAGEDDTLVKEMIDDAAGNDADERQLAAFFADRERANDEKAVEKLYKDISKGMLRRKRGANYELSDSDDDGEARRRMKQREFAKMRKALLADERIGKIAENPKRLAFLRSIEDRNSDDDEDELGCLDQPSDQPETQGTADDGTCALTREDSVQRIPDSQPEVMGPPKRKFSDDISATTQSRLAPHLRRTKVEKRPASLSEIRESLSSLMEDPNSMSSASMHDIDSDDDLDITGVSSVGTTGPEEGGDRALDREANKENRAGGHQHPRRTNIPTIDRLSLKRDASLSMHAASSSTRLAFASSDALASAPGFRVPALLRRATTNSGSLASGMSSASTTSGSSASITRSASLSVSNSTSASASASGSATGTGAASTRLARPAGKSSGVAAFALREAERRSKVVQTQRRREERVVRHAQGRRDIVGGLLGRGRFA